MAKEDDIREIDDLRLLYKRLAFHDYRTQRRMLRWLRWRLDDDEATKEESERREFDGEGE